MNQALKMGKESTVGSFQLFIARILSTTILAISAITIGIFIEDVDYGLYVIALIPAATFLLFQDWGVGAALTKYCAHYRALKEEKKLRKTIVAGITFAVGTGLVLTLVSFSLSGYIASILGETGSASLIALASISIFFTGISAAPRAVFIGFERMDLAGIALICQAAVYFALSPLLVYLGYGAFGITIGYVFSYIVAGTISVILLYFFIFRKLKAFGPHDFGLSPALKTLLRFGVPVAIATIVTGLLTQFYSFMMAYYCDPAIIGHYKVALNFAVLISFFTTPIATVLFPAFSKLHSQNDQQLLESVFSSAVKYTTLFSLPVTVALMVLSTPLIGTLYGSKWALSPFFLSLYLVQFLFVAIGGSIQNSLFQGLGETKTLLKLQLLTFSIGVPLAIILIPMLEIVGIIIAGLFASLPSMFLGLYLIWKKFKVKVDFNSSTKIVISSTIAGLATYLFINTFAEVAVLKLITGASLFLVIYLFSVSLIGALNQTDINNLRVMFSGLGIVSKLLEIPLVIIEFPLKYLTKRSKIRESE